MQQPYRVIPVEFEFIVPGHPEPAFVIRRLKIAGVERYRVVTWAPTSGGRSLIGYFDTGDEAAEVAWRAFVEATNAQHEQASRTHGGAGRMAPNGVRVGTFSP